MQCHSHSPCQSLPSLLPPPPPAKQSHLPFTLLAVLPAGLQLAAHPAIVDQQLLIRDPSPVSLVSQRSVQFNHLGLAACQQLPLQCIQWYGLQLNRFHVRCSYMKQWAPITVNGFQVQWMFVHM